MENLNVKPQLGFGEAIKLAYGRITDFKGRSRRSEFWWFMLVVLITNMVVGLILSKIPIANTIANAIIMACALSVTVRRLQDTGKSAIWVYVSYLANLVYSLYMYTSGIADNLGSVNPDPTEAIKLFTNPVLAIVGLISLVSSICVIVFCIIDGKPEPNKYGESPKYEVVPTEE